MLAGGTAKGPKGARLGHFVRGLLLLGACAGAAGCASDGGRRTVLPVLQEGDTDPAGGYESPPVLRASQLLAPELLKGPHHRVEPEVRTDGFVHLYTIASDFGSFEAQGDDMLRTRVREIRALAVLRERSKTREFAAAAAQGLKSPFVGTWNLIRNPVDSILGVPGEAWSLIRSTAELSRSERGEFEDGAFRAFIGFETRKRQLARQLGVDPYSSNKRLQRELNRFAWVSFAGGLPFVVVPFQDEAESGPPPAPDSGEEETRDWHSQLLALYSPEDLRRLNRIELAVMGIPQPLSDAFLRHPWYSPRHQTLLVAALAGIEASDRGAFLEAALGADSEFDALFYQRSAELLEAYHARVGRIAKIVKLDGTVGGQAEGDRYVFPALVDHVVWTRPTARFVHSLRGRLPVDRAAQAIELVFSGTLSTQARRNIEALGISVTERASEWLGPPGDRSSGRGQGRAKAMSASPGSDQPCPPAAITRYCRDSGPRR